MKKKTVACLLVITLFTLLLSACSQVGAGIESSTESISEELPPADTVAELSQLEKNIAEYELIVANDGTAEQYLALAGFYGEAGMVRKQRDTLERCYWIFQDAAAFEYLKQLVVNIDEESANIRQQAGLLAESLAARHDDAVSLLGNEEWFSLMMPRLWEGQRNYYLENPENKSSLYIEVGYIGGKPYTSAWYSEEDGKTVYLHRNENIVQLLTAALVNGKYNGEFSSLLCIAESGSLFMDSGSFKDGLIVGDFVSETYSAGEPTELSALFAMRNSVEMRTYTGNFNDKGETTLAPPAGIKENQIAYALSENKTDYLYYTPGESDGAGSYIFSYSFFGFSPCPAYSPYVPVPEKQAQGEVTIDRSQLQVRVYDSVVEWFDGDSWQPLGDVGEYISQDPFSAPPTAAAESGGIQDENDVTQQPQWLEGRGSASVPSATAPPRNKPAATKSPDSAPAAPAAPNPAPDPNPAPQPPANPDPPPTNPNPPSGNDGQDIEWSEDIL